MVESTRAFGMIFVEVLLPREMRGVREGSALRQGCSVSFTYRIALWDFQRFEND